MSIDQMEQINCHYSDVAFVFHTGRSCKPVVAFARRPRRLIGLCMNRGGTLDVPKVMKGQLTHINTSLRLRGTRATSGDKTTYSRLVSLSIYTLNSSRALEVRDNTGHVQ